MAEYNTRSQDFRKLKDSIKETLKEMSENIKKIADRVDGQETHI